MVVTDSLDQMLNTVAEVIKPLVVKIESSHPTTKDHYGDYMSVIPRVIDMIGKSDDIDMNRKLHLAVGVALQRAGANKAGVQAALRIMGVL